MFLDFWRLYGPMLLHLVLPSLAFATAIVATVMLVVRHMARPPRRPDGWTPEDDEVDEFIDWRDADAWKQAETSAVLDVEQATCDTCKVHYLMQDGHECPPPPASSLVALPAIGPIASLARKEPLFDREIAPSDALHWEVKFFNNYYQFQYSTDCKTRADTNLYGGQGGLPSGMRSLVYKVSLVADTSMPDEDYAKIYDRGLVEWRMAQSIYASWPCRAIMLAPGERKSKTSEGICDVTVGSSPKVIEAFEHFEFRLTCPETLSKKSGLMFFMWGIQTRAICG